jgi:hypothetical protein
LKIKYRYDTQSQRITWLALLIKEKRSIGHVSPGMDVVSKMIVKVAPLAESPELSDEKLSGLATSPTAALSALAYQSKDEHLQFNYDRRWFVTSEDRNLVVLRMVERGELVAQCNVGLLPAKSEQNKEMTLQDFQHEVQTSLGKNFGQFVNAGQRTNKAGYREYRVTANGQVSELAIQWIYYLIQDKNGPGVSLAFTLEQSLEERFGKADRNLAAQVRLVASPAETAAKPTPAKPDSAVKH